MMRQFSLIALLPLASLACDAPSSPGASNDASLGPIDGGHSPTDAGTDPVDLRPDSGVAGGDTAALSDVATAGGDGSPLFSFFYTSLRAMQRLSNSPNGFGGDLRFGETSGLAGADKICTRIAAEIGFGHKTWRAFLSAVRGPDGQPVHAIDRIGNGPWHDRIGRVLAMNKDGLVGMRIRPAAHPAIENDLPDETGQGTKQMGDTHDVITGSDYMGRLDSTDPTSTCQDWTSTTTKGTINVGHAWPGAKSGVHWIDAHPVLSCAAGINLIQGEGEPAVGSSIGSGGGWGGFYCFALTP